MAPNERPTYYYLFDRGREIEIVKMTDVEAAHAWDDGHHWLDVGQKTLADAEEVKGQLLSGRV